MAWLAARAALLFRQVDPELTHVRSLIKIVMAHQAVEIDGRAHPGISHDAVDFVHRGEKPPEFLQGLLGGLQGGVVGLVGHHQKVALIIERQHLQGHQTQDRQRH